jgi:TRAP-type C4-dicarboxylate transport system substrate-binding protein
MTKTPIKSQKDLRGMELRTGGTQADMLKALGAIPIAMPQTDTPEALQKGVVKGNVSSLEVLKDFNYAAYCPNVTMANLWVFAMAVFMNKAKWDSLPSDVKKVIDDLRKEQALWTGTYVDNHVLDAIKWSKEKYGLQIHEFSDADEAEIAKTLNPFLKNYIKRVTDAGLPGEQIMKDVIALKEKYNKQYK